MNKKSRKRISAFDVGYHTVERYENRKGEVLRDNETGRFVEIPEGD